MPFVFESKDSILANRSSLKATQEIEIEADVKQGEAAVRGLTEEEWIPVIADMTIFCSANDDS